MEVETGWGRATGAGHLAAAPPRPAVGPIPLLPPASKKRGDSRVRGGESLSPEKEGAIGAVPGRRKRRARGRGGGSLCRATTALLPLLPGATEEPHSTHRCSGSGLPSPSCSRRRRIALHPPPSSQELGWPRPLLAMEPVSSSFSHRRSRADERDLKVCWESSHRAQPLFASPAPPRSELPPSDKGSGRQGGSATPGTTAGECSSVAGELYRYQRRSPVATVT
ncbi:uncharacterized protein LOC130950015 [Arachis stenosperma]|uniref:uncharacterized protein LOC130950015 n=1 Tax=Arachis stenosperma TaxID=217475 RepID=UPI0025AC1FC6|nr:uncharacterized protein LOC130950015 [Arachis stenosperma]